MSFAASLPSPIPRALKKLLKFRRSRSLSSTASPASTKLITSGFPSGADSMMLPGCRSPCTKLSVKIILKKALSPRLWRTMDSR
eukprot:4001802-Prymnesium_polylepis.1